MAKIEFTSQQKHDMSEALQKYLMDELQVEVGQFDAEFMFDFIVETFGPAFYNKGIVDVQTVIHRKLQDIDDELYEIEQISKY